MPPLTLHLTCLKVFFTLELEEEGVRISLTIVDTPGFGNNIDNNHTFASILVYVSF